MARHGLPSMPLASVSCSVLPRVACSVGYGYTAAALLARAVWTLFYSWQQRGAAEERGRLALSRQLAAHASKTDGGVQIRLLLGAATNRVAPTDEARQMLQRAFVAQPQIRTFLSGDESQVWSVAFSLDGKTLAPSGQDGTVMLWDVRIRKPRGEPLRGHQSLVRNVTFSPDGKTLASASDDEIVILWDVASRQPLGEPIRAHSTEAAAKLNRELSLSRLHHQLAACERYPDMVGRRSMPSALATRLPRRERGAGTRPPPRWWSPGTRTGGTVDECTVHRPSRCLLALEASCTINRDKLRGIDQEVS